MAEKTSIAWTTSSWSPWIGCTEVSSGCDACYARVLDKRHKWGGATHWGPGIPRHRTSDAYWNQPYVWNRKARESGKPWRVFPSLCDPFDNEVPEAWRSEWWDMIEKTPYLTWLILTKRIGNAPRMLRTLGWAGSTRWNVWLGASIVNQEEADRDLPKLLSIPARKRFVSYEPALGPVNWVPWVGITQQQQIDWLIVGGESWQAGHVPREFNLWWAREAITQCRMGGVPVLIKQLGSRPIDREVTQDGPSLLSIGDWHRLFLKDKAGATPAEWPVEFRVQEIPD